MFRKTIISFVLFMPYLLYCTDTLRLVQFQELVLKNHPLVKSAELFDEIAEAYLLKANGAVDPKLLSDFDAKDFKSTNYFRRWNSEIKIPTRYPVDVSLGYENNSGQFINNDEIIPSNGLLYGTINLSVLRGLMFDAERFLLKESALLANKNNVEKRIIIRDILMQSINAYIEWAAGASELEIISNYLDRVSERHQLIKQLFANGDKPAIDTIESQINLNTARKDFVLAQENLLWKRQKLNNFLWDDSGEPLVLLDTVVPQDLDEVVEILGGESLMINPIWENDLLIRKKDIQLDQLTLENRLEREQLKPQLDLKLNTIHNLGDDDLAYSYNPRDYKLGVSLEVPLRNRKARGQINLNKAIIDQTNLDRSYYISVLDNKYSTLLVSQDLKFQAFQIVQTKLENMGILYEAEQTKFDLGESSIFLLNSRELKLLDTEKDYIKTLKAIGGIYNEIIFLKQGQS